VLSVDYAVILTAAGSNVNQLLNIVRAHTRRSGNSPAR
jgi:hypothetical protein